MARYVVSLGGNALGNNAEEQKAFAEIIFNNWLLRFNDLKEAYNAEYIYFLVTDDNYEEDTFVVNLIYSIGQQHFAQKLRKLNKKPPVQFRIELAA